MSAKPPVCGVSCECRACAAEFAEIAAVGRLPQHRAIAQNLAGHLGQPGSEFGFEVAVLLIDMCELSGARPGLPGQSPEIPGFADLGVVDESAYAPQQGLCLCRRGIAAKTAADLQVAMLMEKSARRQGWHRVTHHQSGGAGSGGVWHRHSNELRRLQHAASWHPPAPGPATLSAYKSTKCNNW